MPELILSDDNRLHQKYLVQQNFLENKVVVYQYVERKPKYTERGVEYAVAVWKIKRLSWFKQLQKMSRAYTILYMLSEIEKDMDKFNKEIKHGNKGTTTSK